MARDRNWPDRDRQLHHTTRSRYSAIDGFVEKAAGLHSRHRKRPDSLMTMSGDFRNTRRLARTQTRTMALWSSGRHRRPAVLLRLPCSRELAAPTTPQTDSGYTSRNAVSMASVAETSETDGRRDDESLPHVQNRTSSSSLRSGNAGLPPSGSPFGDLRPTAA